MKYTFFIILLLFVFCTKKNYNTECNTNNTNAKSNKKEINGVSLEAVNYQIDSTHINPIKNLNATWITAMPFGFISNGDDSVQFNNSFQWIGETKQGIANTINLAHNAGIKVMIKPHIWMHNSWVGELEFNTENQWTTFERTYTKYIIDFAKLSDSLNVEAFCIGVELKKATVQRPNFWFTLIDSVKSIYSGPITYAANWDNYQNITFWDSLDYIGIDAYFPISTSQTPTITECYDGWLTNFNLIKSLSFSKNKKVIFTEFGYRNIDYTGKEPWFEGQSSTFNSTGQENAYTATFNRFWGEDWFEGGFLWKWHPTHQNAGGIANNRFTPQNKPVQEIIKNTFSSSN